MACEVIFNSVDFKKILIVSYKVLSEIGIVQRVTALLSSMNIKFTIFDSIRQNPLEEDIEKGTEIYKKNNCDSIIAIGGGSVIDMAKMIYFFVGNKCNPRAYLSGDVKCIGESKPLIAIPTTSGRILTSATECLT